MFLSALSVVGIVLDIILLIASGALLGWSAYKLIVAVKERKIKKNDSKKKGEDKK